MVHCSAGSSPILMRWNECLESPKLFPSKGIQQNGLQIIQIYINLQNLKFIDIVKLTSMSNNVTILIKNLLLFLNELILQSNYLFIQMSKKSFPSRFQIKNSFKLPQTIAPVFSLKRNSNSKRIKTEAYDFSQEKEKSNTKKMQVLLGGVKKNRPLSKSIKKSSQVMHKHEKKSSEVSNLRLSDMTATLSKIREPKLFKGSQELLSTNFGTRGFTKNSQDNKKHSRMKTQIYDEKPSTKIAEIYKKLGNISFVKEKQQSKNPEKTYKIEEIVGKGTFGVVYKATNKITQEVVAIKKVLQDKRYKNRELQIMKMLHHTNVLEIKDHYYTNQGGQEYLNVVMEFFKQNLYNFNRQKIKKGDSISPIQIKVYSYQMFKAINYLASLSIAHRDIKPHNILIDPDTNKLVICDFGSAKQLVPTQSNLAYICSRCYRAPQLIFGATDYNPQIDMWSIGCVIIEMINGDPPFCGDSQVDQLIEILKVLGTPSQETVLEMNPNYDMREYQFPQVNPREWRKILRSKTDPLLIDLINKIMRYSPQRRITPFEAMCHQYFNDLRDQDKYKEIVTKIKCKDLHVYNKQQITMSKQFIKRLLPQWY